MRTVTKTAAVGLFASALLLASCGSDDAAKDDTTTTAAKTETTAAAADIEISDAWARQSPDGTTMGAAYMNITSADGDVLTGASVPVDIAAEAQIHEMVPAGDAGMGEDSTEGSMDETTTTAADDSGDMGDGSSDMGDDSMTMQEIDKLEIPAGETVKLEPGGYHVMLIDLVEPLEVGQTFDVTLTFEKAGDKTVTVEVKEG